MKIKTLLILVLIIFVIVPPVAFAITAGIEMNSLALTNYTSTTKAMAENQSYNLAQYMESLSVSAKQIADNPAILDFNKAGDSTAALDVYKRMIENDDGTGKVQISRIILAKKSDGNIVCDTMGAPSDDSAAFKTALNIGNNCEDGAVTFYAADVYTQFDEEDRERTDPLFTDTTKSSDIKLMCKYTVGDYYVIVFFNDTAIKAFATSTQFSNNSALILIDPNGSIMHGSYIGNVRDNKNQAYNKFVSSAQAGSVTQADNFNGTGANVVSTIGFTQKLSLSEEAATAEGEWTLAVIAQTDKAYDASVAAMGKIVELIVLITIVFVTVAIILTVMITKPIKVIEETLVKVCRGDHEARINVMANNEYGEIARAFNDLIDDIVVSEGRYRTIIEVSDNIIFEWNFKSNEVFFSNNFNKKFSYRAPSDHFGDSFLLKVKVHPEDSERYHKDLEKLSKGEEFKGNEYRWKNIYGDYIWILLRTATIRNRDGSIAKIVGVVVDIDRAKKSEMMLTERASYDSLTGLYNRESIERTIENEIELISVRMSQFAILFIDVDDFKIYNDKYSHATGDQVLKFVANTISKITEGFGVVGRYGGDEFVACIRNVEINEPTRVAQDILNTLKEGFMSDNGEKLTVNASIGITVIEDSSMHVDEIIGMADDAMYKIKKSGKSNFGILNRKTASVSPVPTTVEEIDVIGGEPDEEHEDTAPKSVPGIGPEEIVEDRLD